ncbi:hypothetical protein [Streptomyces sp. NPDC001665]
MTLTHPPTDGAEAARLLSVARDVFPADGSPETVLRTLRTLAAVLDSRHVHDGVIILAALLKAAGVKQP